MKTLRYKSYDVDMLHLRTILINNLNINNGTQHKLPLDARGMIECVIPLRRFSHNLEKHTVMLLPSCDKGKMDTEFYLHRIKIKCRHCEKFFDAGHLKQHKC